ncbi:MAG: hypothetical protein U9N02_04345 [Campylobacterota bacterium]|nr:hypothetical protein [Campylobacterota bacterium]
MLKKLVLVGLLFLGSSLSATDYRYLTKYVELPRDVRVKSETFDTDSINPFYINSLAQYFGISYQDMKSIYDNEIYESINNYVDVNSKKHYDSFDNELISLHEHGGETEIAIVRVPKQPASIPGYDIFTLYNITDASNYKQIKIISDRTINNGDGTITEFYDLDDMSSNNKVFCLTVGKKYQNQNITMSFRFGIQYKYQNKFAHYKYAGECSASFVHQ